MTLAGLLICGTAASEAELVRLRRGEVVITRPAAGTGILAGRSQGIIAAPVEEVWQVLSDCGRFAEYMPRYLVSSMVGREVADSARLGNWDRARLERVADSCRLAKWPGDTAFFYNVLDLPFPFHDRWYLLEMIQDTETHAVDWIQVMGNTRENYGSWRLKPFCASSETTLVTYSTFSSPGVHLPGFVLNIGLKSTLPGVITALRHRVEEQRRH